MDIAICVVAGMMLIPLILILFWTVKLTSAGNAIYWSERVGLNGKIFKMAKFRTMKVGTPQIATHMMASSTNYTTPVGRYLRKTSMDELPQIYNILKGEISLVGPRPALFNQTDLISLRKKHGVDTILPGLTGWAQINGRDELGIPKKVEYDLYYLKNRSLFFDVRIIVLTLFSVLRSSGVSH